MPRIENSRIGDVLVDVSGKNAVVIGLDPYSPDEEVCIRYDDSHHGPDHEMWTTFRDLKKEAKARHTGRWVEETGEVLGTIERMPGKPSTFIVRGGKLFERQGGTEYRRLDHVAENEMEFYITHGTKGAAALRDAIRKRFSEE